MDLARLEIGSNAPLGHARTDVSANTFSVELKPTVLAIDDNLTTPSKTITSIYNLQGQSVNNTYQGLVIIRYTDGTSEKVVQ